MPASTIWRVSIDEAAWQADLRGASAAARSAAVAWRQRIAVLRGIPQGELLACRPQDDAGVGLPRCVKTRIPNPGSASLRESPWGAVLAFESDERGLYLSFRAFGLRHPEEVGSTKPSVYQVAHDRLFAAG